MDERNARKTLAVCGKTISAQQGLDGLHVWDKPGLSGYLVHLVSLMQPNKPDRPNRPNEQDRLADFFSILLVCCHNDGVSRIIRHGHHV
jgi:hypothetical protein